MARTVGGSRRGHPSAPSPWNDTDCSTPGPERKPAAAGSVASVQHPVGVVAWPPEIAKEGTMGFLKGRIEDYSSPLAALPVRLYTGYFFLKYGLAKFTGGFGGAGLHETLSKWAEGPAYHFYVPFLQRVAIPHASLFAHFVTLGEIVVGSLLLLGCACRLAALGGLF